MDSFVAMSVYLSTRSVGVTARRARSNDLLATAQPPPSITPTQIQVTTRPKSPPQTWRATSARSSRTPSTLGAACRACISARIRSHPPREHPCERGHRWRPRRTPSVRRTSRVKPSLGGCCGCGRRCRSRFQLGCTRPRARGRRCEARVSSSPCSRPTTQLSSGGGCWSYEPRKAYMPPPSAAADGSASSHSIKPHRASHA